MEKWILNQKKADFHAISQKYQIDPLIARLIRNRDIIEDRDIANYMFPSLENLHSPFSMHDIEKAASIILHHIRLQHTIMIANDFDCDGICSGFLLLQGLQECNATVFVETPDRVQDGYGLNERIVREAKEKGVSLIITCDNGIVALEPIRLAKELGLDVVVTDHHEIPYKDTQQGRVFLRSDADAIVNPKQIECKYPFKGLCGAGVAFKLLQVIFEKAGINVKEIEKYLQVVALATIADVMSLVDENRILVKIGLRQMEHTTNLGLKTLLDVNNLLGISLSSYHIGFVLAPCLNASGRLDTAKKAVELLCAKSKQKAYLLANELKVLNDTRKAMTVRGLEQAMSAIEQTKIKEDKILVVEISDCHESLVGIIAGRVRDKYNKPVIVLTEVEHGMKGSGRSIEAYNMFEEVNKCNTLLTSFGGHAMACGLSIEKKFVSSFRKQLNEQTSLIEDDFAIRVMIDADMPIDYITEKIIEEISILEPFGKGNSKPLFGEKYLNIKRATFIGKNRNYLKLYIENIRGKTLNALFFGDADDFKAYVIHKFGEAEVDNMFQGKKNKVKLMLTYYPQMNEFNGSRTMQLIIQNYK